MGKSDCPGIGIELFHASLKIIEYLHLVVQNPAQPLDLVDLNTPMAHTKNQTMEPMKGKNAFKYIQVALTAENKLRRVIFTAVLSSPAL